MATFINETLGNSPLPRLNQKNTRPEKFERTVLAVRWSVKYFFVPNFPTFCKSLNQGRKQIAKQLQSVFCFTSKHDNGKCHILISGNKHEQIMSQNRR